MYVPDVRTRVLPRSDRDARYKTAVRLRSHVKTCRGHDSEIRTFQIVLRWHNMWLVGMWPGGYQRLARGMSGDDRSADATASCNEQSSYQACSFGGNSLEHQWLSVQSYPFIFCYLILRRCPALHGLWVSVFGNGRRTI